VETSESIPEGEGGAWSGFWERCETVVASEFRRVGQALQLSWASGGGHYSQGFRKYAEFSRVGKGGPLPGAGSVGEMIERGFIEGAERQDFRADVKITVDIELDESNMRYQADLRARGQTVRQGPSSVVGLPAREADLTCMLDEILSEISQFIRDCEDPILDIVS
jgi:hypothetical protein